MHQFWQNLAWSYCQNRCNESSLRGEKPDFRALCNCIGLLPLALRAGGKKKNNELTLQRNQRDKLGVLVRTIGRKTALT